MKRNIGAVFTLVLIITTLASCTQNPAKPFAGEGSDIDNNGYIGSSIVLSATSFEPGKYTVLESSDNDSLSAAKHTDDIDLTYNDYINEAATASKTVTLDGTAITGTYKNSKRSNLFLYDIDCYEYTESGKRISFGINRNNGKCYTYSWVDTSYADSVSGDELSRDECAAKAKDYLKQLVSNDDAYIIVNERYQAIPEYKSVYTFEFNRKVNGLATSDQIFITITAYGKICGHRMIMPEEMNNAAVSVSYNDNELLKSLNSKVYQVYSEAYTKEEREHIVKDITLIKLYDGKLAYKYSIETELTPSGGKAFVELTDFIVVIE